MLRRFKQPKIAPVSARLLAGAVDAVTVLPVVLGAGGCALYFVTRRRRRARGGAGDDADEIERWLSKPQVEWGVRVFGLVSEVAMRNSRGPGARIVGIRRADARTGGPVTVRSALIHYAVGHGSGAAVKQLTSAATKGQSARIKAIQPELREVQRAHAGDPEAAQQATMKLYRDHRINPLNSCGFLLAQLIVMNAPALFTERSQTLADRIAGIVVVEV